MTIAEQLRKEGRQQGMQQEKQRSLLKILSKRFGSLPETTKKQIQAASMEQLDSWIDAALDADNLEQIFAS